MINVTDSAIVNKIKGTGRTFTLSLVVGSNTYTMVKSLKRSSIFASSQKLSVGETVSAFIEAEIQNCRQSLQNYEVQPKLTIDGYTFNLGYFKVQAPSQADGSGTQKITAYDRMAETSKYTYKATGLTSAKSTFSAICSICGYTAVTSGLTDVSINDRLLDGMDCRKALGYIAGVFGNNCVVGTDGKFKMVGYSTISESVCKISIDSLDTLEFPSELSTIDYFNAVINDETAYKSGTGNNGVNVVNPLFTSITQTSNILTNLKSSVGGSGYYPAKFKQLNGDPRIEVGDVIKVEHRDILTGEVTADYVPVMSLTLDYDGGVTVSIESYPTEDEFSMSLSDKVDFTNSSNNAKFEDINNKVDGFEEGIDGANTKADFAVIQAQAVEELNKVIGNSLGLYQTKIEGAGGDTKYYFHNKETLAQSTYIISMTDQGFAFANSWNNGNPVWTYGINPAGNSIMNYLVVNKISADLIKAGVIRSLDGAPINTEFSLNTGLFSLESDSQKELFGFGANRYNHLLLQYNYSDGQKNNIKLGYYYGGQFYKNSGHTEIIPPNENYYYGDMPSGNFYQYSSNRYTVMSDLTDVLKTYKGFIFHSCGRTLGYNKNDPLFGIVSDFNANMEELLGGNLGIVEGIEDAPELRTPILKFYDFENESANGQSHYTALRKQSIVTKHLGAETFCFYLNGKSVDLDTVLTDLVTSVNSNYDKIQSSEITIQELENTIEDLSNDLEDAKATLSVLPDYKSRIESLEKAVIQLNELLGVKVLSVYVIANPTEGGSVSGSGSYTLNDREVLIEATANAGYFISSVKFVYASDGETTTEQYGETKTDYSVYRTVFPERLGDTLNVFVNFGKKAVPKYTISTSVSPSGSGSVSGGGTYENGKSVTLRATANSGYQFKQWTDGNTSNPRTITVNGNASYTAVFEKEQEEVQTATIEIFKSGNYTNDDDVSLLTPQGTWLGTSTELSYGDSLLVTARTTSNRQIIGLKSYLGASPLDFYSQTELISKGWLYSDKTALRVPIDFNNSNWGGRAITYYVEFDEKTESGGGSGDSATIKISSSGAVSGEVVLLTNESISVDHGAQKAFAIGETYTIYSSASSTRKTTKVEVYTNGTISETYYPSTHPNYWYDEQQFYATFTVDSSKAGKTIEYKAYFGT